MTEKVISPKFSFSEWDVIEFVKGRKKMIITAVASLLAYVISSDILISAIAGPAVEMLIGVAEFYFNEYTKA